MNLQLISETVSNLLDLDRIPWTWEATTPGKKTGIFLSLRILEDAAILHQIMIPNTKNPNTGIIFYNQSLNSLENKFDGRNGEIVNICIQLGV
jgi:hypothetical protein